MSNKKQKPYRHWGMCSRKGRGRGTLEKNGHLPGSLNGAGALLRKQIRAFESKPGRFLPDPGGKPAHFAPNQQDAGLGRKVLKCLSAVWWGKATRPPPQSPASQRTFWLVRVPQPGQAGGVEGKAMS